MSEMRSNIFHFVATKNHINQTVNSNMKTPLSILLICLFLAIGAKSCPMISNAVVQNAYGIRSNDVILGLRGGEVLTPSDDDIDAVLLNAATANKLVVIDFTASWCGPCKMIAPLFKELSEEMGNAVFLKIDVDENPETAARYSVSAMPTFVFIKAGEVVDRLMGANPARLREMIEEYS